MITILIYSLLQTSLNVFYELSDANCLSQWPGDTAVSRVLAGMPGNFPSVSPLRLDQGNDKVRIWPLVTIKGNDLWDHPIDKLNMKLKRDPTTAKSSYLVAAAAQRDKQRLVVFTDKYWTSDRYTTVGVLPNGRQVAVTSNPDAGVLYPANTELFINSVCWLSDLDALIARSARTQDIPRIEPISDKARSALKWSMVAGMPILILFLGISVWLIRRRA